MTDLLIELPDTSVVRRSSVILVVTSELAVEGFLLLVHRLVSVLLAPFGDCRRAPFKPFLHRSHVHGELPLSTACAYVREAEDVQSAGFFPCLFALASAYHRNSTSRVFSGWSVRPVKAYQVWADALKPILTQLLGPPLLWITPHRLRATPLRDTDRVRRQT
jgi:hypothetical protein